MLIQEEDIIPFFQAIRHAGQKIVFTNGCFDILHAGHVRYLKEARSLGDCLVLGLNSDASVRALKGETRPINSEADRAEVTGALAAVDYVVIFSEPTAAALLKKIRPAIYVKGGDYALESLPEAAVLAEIGAEAAFITMVEGRSTTNVIARIKACEKI